MRHLIAATAILCAAMTGSALAETTASTGTQPNAQITPNSNAAPNSQQTMAAAQKIKQDLQTAGFQDVNVVAESFVVQAKTKDGNPVVMTIGPHGMSVFEAMNLGKSGKDASASANTTGSTKQQ